MGIKKQVQVAAHTSAKVIQNSDGMLLKFSPLSAFCWQATLFSGANQDAASKLFFFVFYDPCADCAKATLTSKYKSALWGCLPS
jgi:hypothetical protein